MTKRFTKKWVVYDGQPLFSADTIDEALSRRDVWCKGWAAPARITAVRVAPDGVVTTTQPAAGGTWGGRCGATFWVDDPDFHIVPQRQISTHQAWHYHWVLGDSPYFRIEDRSERALGGFRVECSLPVRHDGQCSAGQFRWTWEHAVDAQENSFRRTGLHQEVLL